jgi:hypothetical protein
MDDYEPEGPVRLRQQAQGSVEPVASPQAAAPPAKKYLPMWAAILLIIGLIVFGWSLAQL